MFTGIVEETGQVTALDLRPEGATLVVSAEGVAPGTRLGDSIAVEGVCLTVTDIARSGQQGAALLTFGLAPETLSRTALGALGPGDAVNLERSVTPTTRMGGHFVQGHVDATGTVRAQREDGEALWVEIACPPDLMKYIVTKGYIAIDGTSLTVVDTGPDWFSVTLVAYTQAHITLPGKPPGTPVNLEVDVLGKYVEKLIAAAVPSTSQPIKKEVPS